MSHSQLHLTSTWKVLWWREDTDFESLDVKWLTLSWRRSLSYRNQSTDLLRKSMDWFLYDNGLRHEKVEWPGKRNHCSYEHFDFGFKKTLQCIAIVSAFHFPHMSYTYTLHAVCFQRKMNESGKGVRYKWWMNFWNLCQDTFDFKDKTLLKIKQPIFGTE